MARDGLTEKQKKFIDFYIETGNATESILKAYGSLRGFKNLSVGKFEDPVGLVIECISVLDGETASVNAKYSAILIMKCYLMSDLRKSILDNPDLYPINRNDYRVKIWTKNILSVAHCEECNSTNNLHAHHLIKWADYPKGRIDPKNGVCLCDKCHAIAHKDDKSYYMLQWRAQANERTKAFA